MKKKYKQGFALIEAMVAVVVFSFGLLGVAGVMTVSVKNNHNGYMRSQAAFLASSAIDMMRRNQLGLWAGNYNGIFSGYVDVSASCALAAGCNSTNLAARDVQEWSNMIDQLLPNSSGQIDCVSGGAPFSPIPVMIINPLNPPNLMVCQHCSIEQYNGFCDVTITWSESNIRDASSTQTYLLTGKP